MLSRSADHLQLPHIYSHWVGLYRCKRSFTCAISIRATFLSNWRMVIHVIFTQIIKANRFRTTNSLLNVSHLNTPHTYGHATSANHFGCCICVAAVATNVDLCFLCARLKFYLTFKFNVFDAIASSVRYYAIVFNVEKKYHPLAHSTKKTSEDHWHAMNKN